MNAQPMFLPPPLNALLEELVKDAGVREEVRAALKTSAAENASQHQAHTDFAGGLFDCLRVVCIELVGSGVVKPERLRDAFMELADRAPTVGDMHAFAAKTLVALMDDFIERRDELVRAHPRDGSS